MPVPITRTAVLQPAHHIHRQASKQNKTGREEPEMGRAPCCDKATVKRGPWSPEEDAMLTAYIQDHGTGNNWIALPHKIGLKRCGKSCRLRWLNYLRPNIKHGDFTPEEDTTICSLYISIGSRWSVIAAQLPGRTDNDVKNYWNTKLKKRFLGGRRKVGPRGSAAVSDGERTMSASAMERIQLCMQLQEMRGGYPLQLWSDQSCNSSSSGSLNVTPAAEQQQQQRGGQSSGSMDNDSHHIGRERGEHLESATTAMDSSPSSAENSDDFVTIEAELQELLYGGAAMIDVAQEQQQQQGAVNWWSYDQGMSSSPLNCWEFTAEASSVFQASVYDISSV